MPRHERNSTAQEDGYAILDSHQQQSRYEVERRREAARGLLATRECEAERRRNFQEERDRASVAAFARRGGWSEGLRMEDERKNGISCTGYTEG